LERVQEDEPEVVDIAVMFLVFQEPAVMLGLLPPLVVADPLITEPHQAGVEAGTPVGPQLPLVLPAAVGGVDGEVVGIAVDRGADLLRGQVEGPLQSGSKVPKINETRLGHRSRAPASGVWLC